MDGEQDDSYIRDESKTVRILPDDAAQAGAYDDSVGQDSLRKGTLYTRGPQSMPERDFKPYEPSTRRSLPAQDPLQGTGTAITRTEPPQAVAVVPARKGPSTCSIFSITFLLLALACSLLAFGTVQQGFDGLGKLSGIIPSFPDLGLVTTPTVTIDNSRPAVISSVRALSKVETVHYEMEKVVSGQSTGPLPDFLTSDKILLVAHGQVVAGIDLAKIAPEDITVEGEMVVITMPEPEILYSRLDNDKTYVYDRQTGIFSKPDPNLETQIRQAAEEQIKLAALEGGILAKAKANGEQVVRTLVTGLGYKDVEFTDK
ncbi:MAG TPA: DUF4230 domain-containing protein [Chloroflexia bacterium]